MNILFIAGTDITIHPNHRAHHFISYLESLGAQVDVVCHLPFYTGGQAVDALARYRYGLRERYRRPFEITPRKNGVQLAVRMLPGRLDDFVHSYWSYLHFGPLTGKRYDLCIFGNPSNVLLPLLLKRRGLIGTLIYDDWDFYPGFNRSWIWTRLTRFRERLCIGSAKLVISVGGLLSDLRKEQGAARTLVIPNGVDYRIFASAQNKRPHPPTLVYMGKLGADWGIDVSIEGFAQMCKQMPDARYLIIGYNQGTYVLQLQRQVERLGLNGKVLFLGGKPYEELPHYLADADVGVALHNPNDLMRYAFPLKVVEYMAAGLAVVGTGIGETEKLILEGQAGRCVSFSPEAFADAVLEILGNKPLLDDYCRHAQDYARRYDWTTVFSSLPDLAVLCHLSETD